MTKIRHSLWAAGCCMLVAGAISVGVAICRMSGNATILIGAPTLRAVRQGQLEAVQLVHVRLKGARRGIDLRLVHA